MCGEVRYRAHGNPFKAAYCYCQYCRRASAAVVSAWLMFRAGQIEFLSGELKKYASSPPVLRGFCPNCGTNFWWEGRWDGLDIEMVQIGSLDDPELYPPDRHANCHNRISWFDTADDLPRYREDSPPGK